VAAFAGNGIGVRLRPCFFLKKTVLLRTDS
jgi:hypothetical protein